jgi:chromate transporter
VIGARRAGPLGGLFAWLAFTAPSALILAACGIAIRAAGDGNAGTFTHSAGFGGSLEGLAAAAAGVVLTAIVQMGRGLIRSTPEAAIAIVALALTLLADRYASGFQWIGLAAGAGLGAAFIRSAPALPKRAPALAISHRTAMICGAVFFVLLLGTPIVATPNTYLDLFATFFRAGSLVFGGGHVVLPFLANFIGASVPERTFFAGYGITQAMPGPLFTFSAFLGGAARPLGGALPALVAVIAIFLPSFLLIAAVMPLWVALRELPRSNDVLAGINASVVGLLGAVFVAPIATSLAHDPLGIAFAIAAFFILIATRLPAWVPVVACAAIGYLVRAGTFVH